MQSLDPDVGLPGREALGPDPTLGGVVPLPGGLAVPKLVEDPPGEGLQHRAGFARWGSAAPEHVNYTSSGRAGPETGSRGLRIHPGENPCQDLRWGQTLIRWPRRSGSVGFRACFLDTIGSVVPGGGSPSVWVRLPPRALLKAARPPGDRGC